MSFSELMSVIALGGAIVGVYIKTQIDLAVIKNTLKSQQKQIDDNKQVVNQIFSKLETFEAKMDVKFEKIHEHFLSCQRK